MFSMNRTQKYYSRGPETYFQSRTTIISESPSPQACDGPRSATTYTNIPCSQWGRRAVGQHGTITSNIPLRLKYTMDQCMQGGNGTYMMDYYY